MAAPDSWSMFTPRRRLLAGLALGSANLIVVLDMTIANVSIPHISGNLGISASQGTWVITSYAVAEAICVPLTGWLAQRFGSVRTFVTCMIGFGIFSVLCGLSLTLGMLVACRIGQGLCGGPLVPLTQTLLLRIFPPERRASAMGLWAITTMIGPVLGPILGGTISDNWSWHWIFFINVPVVIFCATTCFIMLRPIETPVVRIPIDRVGLVLMIIWISALQIMLDIGREHDWFADTTVVMLALTAAIGFVVFVIWELTEEHPIVDLRVFRHRTYTVGVLTLAFSFATYFAGIVLIPQWMQLSLGYTATQAGIATAFTAFAGLLVVRFPPMVLARFDARLVLSVSLFWIGGATLLRTNWTSSADFFTLAYPQFVMGLAMSFFFVTVTTLSLSTVPAKEIPAAAGIQNFIRIIAVAAATSLTVTFWNDQARIAGSELAGKLHTDGTTQQLTQMGFSADQIRVLIAQLVDKEALTLATDKVFLITGLMTWAIAACVWFAPKSRIGGPVSSGH